MRHDSIAIAWVCAFAVIGVVVGFILGFVVAIMAQPTVPEEVVEVPAGVWQPPELVACGENGAYRCMSDEDYMQMIVFGQFVRHLYEDPYRPKCEQAGCVCAMSEEYKR